MKLKNKIQMYTVGKSKFFNEESLGKWIQKISKNKRKHQYEIYKSHKGEIIIIIPSINLISIISKNQHVQLKPK